MTQQPQAKYRHDYRAPEYLISDIDLTFDLDAAKTVVTAESKVSRHAAASDVPLRLDGEDLTLIALHLRACSQVLDRHLQYAGGFRDRYRNRDGQNDKNCR